MKQDKIPIKKIHLIAVFFLIFIAAAVSANSSQISSLFLNSNKSYDTSKLSSLSSELFPQEGFKTKIILGDTIPKLVDSGAIDLEKLKQVYGSLTEDQTKFLTEPSNEPLVITTKNANFLLTILWPLGISNKNTVLNEAGNYSGVANLASTGGWDLGKANTMTYFNDLEIAKLTPEQQINLEEVANNSYRPCCDNPTSFPDCNHGAALLALLELGASQGLSKEELYTLALQANTLWFPQQYLSTAVYLKIRNVDYWSSAKDIMGFRYSSASGWTKNVYKPLQENGLLPKTEGGGSCSV